MTPKVAIIYLSYNARPYLDAVASSIEHLDYPKDSLEWVIVDNASPDNSAELIRQTVMPKSGKELPRVTFFANQTNGGFAEGNNIGIRHAMENGADYVYLLNNDAKLHPRAIAEAVKMAQSDPKIGSVQSLIRLWQDESTLNVTAGMVHFLGFGYARDNGRRASAQELSAMDGEEIAYASGAAVLYRASALAEVGIIEPFYFMYHDDLELGWRLRLAGYRNVLAVASIAYHKYEFHRSIKKLYWMERARFLVLFSHLKPATLVLLFPFFVLCELPLLAFAVKSGWWRDKLQVYRDLWQPKSRAHVREKRGASQRIRKVGDREIVRLWTGKIEHQEMLNPIVEYVGNPLLNIGWNILRTLIKW